MKDTARVKLIREFVSYVIGKPVVIPRDRNDNNWNISIMTSEPRLYIPKDLNNMDNDEEDIIFRDNFIMRCPIADEFSDITLTLLHECGHWMTKSNFDPEEYEEQCAEVEDMYDYINIPCEYIATEWAINWLKEHSQIAREFEYKYFME